MVLILYGANILIDYVVMVCISYAILLFSTIL